MGNEESVIAEVLSGKLSTALTLASVAEASHEGDSFTGAMWMLHDRFREAQDTGLLIKLKLYAPSLFNLRDVGDCSETLQRIIEEYPVFDSEGNPVLVCLPYTLNEGPQVACFGCKAVPMRGYISISVFGGEWVITQLESVFLRPSEIEAIECFAPTSE